MVVTVNALILSPFVFFIILWKILCLRYLTSTMLSGRIGEGEFHVYRHIFDFFILLLLTTPTGKREFAFLACGLERIFSSGETSERSILAAGTISLRRYNLKYVSDVHVREKNRGNYRHSPCHSDYDEHRLAQTWEICPPVTRQLQRLARTPYSEWFSTEQLLMLWIVLLLCRTRIEVRGFNRIFQRSTGARSY